MRDDGGGGGDVVSLCILFFTINYDEEELS